jgi:protein Hikeshi
MNGLSGNTSTELSPWVEFAGKLNSTRCIHNGVHSSHHTLHFTQSSIMNTMNSMNIDFSSQPNALPTPAPSQQPFGILIPGRPVRTDFAPVDASNTRFALQLSCPGDITGPLSSVREIAFFTLPHIPFPPNQGVMVYWQTAVAPNAMMGESTTGFELLGYITPDCPSQIFATGWSEHDQVTQMAAMGLPLIITIGASVEPLMSIQNVADNRSNMQGHANKLHIAHKIALDLFNFMRSFDTGVAGNGYMTVPNNIFDRWYKRFETRFQRDPNFFLKSED